MEYKRIDEREVYLLMKRWFEGKIEFIGAYWTEDRAKRIAAENLPRADDLFAVSLHTIKLHGSMIDIKGEK
jgi:hypothetical protein